MSQEKITDLVWRPLTGDDAQALADLLNAAEAVDKTNENYDEEDVREELADPYSDLALTLAAVAGDRIVGYIRPQWKAQPVGAHRIFVDGVVHPDHRRRGIGTRLIRTAVDYAKILHERNHPGLPLIVDTQNGEHVAGVAELLTGEGFRAVRYFQDMEQVLTGSLPEAVPPAGLRFEAWTPENDADFMLVRNESFLDHFGSSIITPESWKNRVTNHNFQPELSFLLREVETNRPAGMLVTMHWEADTVVTGRRDAHFHLIGTLRDFRKRGVASSLIAHALRAAGQAGFDTASLGVDAENPSGAFGVYERAGFVAKDRHIRWALEV